MVSTHITELVDNVPIVLDSLLEEIGDEARSRGVPIVQPMVGRLVYLLAIMLRAERILEIGTAIGYSTAWLAKAVTSDAGKVTTIEIKPGQIREAVENWEKLKLRDKIDIICGDANEVLPNLSGTYDIIFIDAAKGQYPSFFKLCFPLLRKGGLLITDNVLFQGMVQGETGVPRRYRTFVKRVKEYNDIILNHPELETVILPLGDGLALSFRK